MCMKRSLFTCQNRFLENNLNSTLTRNDTGSRTYCETKINITAPLLSGHGREKENFKWKFKTYDGPFLWVNCFHKWCVKFNASQSDGCWFHSILIVNFFQFVLPKWRAHSICKWLVMSFTSQNPSRRNFLIMAFSVEILGTSKC